MNMAPTAKQKTAGKPAKSGVTPMFAQYGEIKARHPDCLLFFRMGDFYEMFFDDAIAAAPVLGIALTQRGTHAGEPVPMAGVPVHSAEQYLPRLIRAGFRVAVCEQTEDPAEAKKRGPKAIVNRAVVRIITAGTLTEEGLLNSRANNYLCAVAEAGGALGLAWADISTGETWWQPVEDGPIGLAAALARIDPGELLVPEPLAERQALATLWHDHEEALLALPASRFDSRNAVKRLHDVFKVGDVAALVDLSGDPPSRAEIAALGAVIDYVAITQIGRLPHLDRPQRLTAAGPGTGVMEIDAATRRNLELTRGSDGDARTSLLATIDRTITAAGARLLAQRLAAPLTSIAAIEARLDMVAFYVDGLATAQPITEALRDALRGVPDVDRALSRLDLERGGPRDLAAIRDAASVGEALRTLHGEGASMGGQPEGIAEAVDRLGGNDALTARLTAALGPDLPMLARDGGFIAAGCSASLDQQRQLRDGARQLIAGLQSQYAELSGVAALKIKHNNVLGYFIEVSALHGDKLRAPELPFIHRQTLANQVRFTTAELGELVEKITLAQDRALAIELDLFAELAGAVAEHRDGVAATGRAIAELDVAAALAALAVAETYCRPAIDEARGFAVVAGRHPVVEPSMRAAQGEPFVANDCHMNEAAQRPEEGPEKGPEDGQEAESEEAPDNARGGLIWLLTGPNMAGKSTFLRQNALIVVLAQAGSFVPAQTAAIGIVDRVFSRVGAADDLARGRSTFMVEMVETATILAAATARSFVILDEIGRGTSTYDGLSIAWAVMEYLHETNKCRTLFATHYHELTSLAERLDDLSCHTMRVKEWKGSVVFLHEVAPGAADRSYGIHVAELAGLPGPVLARAREILTRVEKSEQSRALRSLVSDLPLFQTADAEAETSAGSAVERALDELKLDEMSPREALDALYSLRELLDE